MKRIQFKLVLFVTSFFLSMGAFAQQNGSGIYKTADDFKSGKLSLAIDCKTEKHKIKLNDFFGKNNFTVIHNDSVYKFEKKDVYAYKLCSGEIYRFSGVKDYLVLNPTESIQIYREEIQQAKAAFPKVYKYYFSRDAVSAFQDLSKDNLKSDFPENHKFHDALDETFKSDADLASYDNFHKMYKVNHVLEMNSK